MGSNPTQAQCNFSSEELRWVSHGVVGGKRQYFTKLVHSDIISWLLSPLGLSGGPYWYFTSKFKFRGFKKAFKNFAKYIIAFIFAKQIIYLESPDHPLQNDI